MYQRATLLAAMAGVFIVGLAGNAPEASAQGYAAPVAMGAGTLPNAAGQMGYQQPRAYGQSWGSSAANTDWNRMYHYPYVYYPQNFWGQDYYKSSDSLYHRYPTEMRIPVYNKQWHNYYPSNRRFHKGHHFILDTF
ncbi:calmodulin-binding protein [Rhodopirellula sp. JC740]|uniref:Calmodulin-binding protein n=1 Tax=Rhodopirellula halodulae TaxID=2894198 RepID=A0ABS8ND48_9BACT|nr:MULTISPECIES: calmodulin-binding protein [unclassified Rhodopirellula]MCC9641480.1 calmodulin-binding protein [Rhodopirellula sp. JC740]MCC9657888.1 calmodulin-binding protein [Rhodopirellula sp. JC737]